MKLLSIIYGFIVFLRNKLYDLKIFKEKKSRWSGNNLYRKYCGRRDWKNTSCAVFCAKVFDKKIKRLVF